MPEFQSLIFTEGVSRQERALLKHPYNLRNVRIHQFGEVKALKSGTVLTGTDRPGAPKPWFRFNDLWVTGAS